MPSVLPARSCRFLSSTSASVLLWRSRPSSCVSSPIAKYDSCSRAHGPQKATPRISTSALRGQGFSVLLRTWQEGPCCVTASIKRTFLLRIRDPLLVIRSPPVSAPATNRARTLRKDISSLETPIAAVRQAYNGRPVRPCCRLLCFLFGSVCLGLHLHSLP